jgi:hypothetical protein
MFADDTPYPNVGSKTREHLTTPLLGRFFSFGFWSLRVDNLWLKFWVICFLWVGLVLLLGVLSC